MPSLNRKKVGTSALACAAQMGLDVLSDPKNTQILMCFILVAELVFNIFIIRRIKYTEIDWSTYMQQVEVYRSGNYNYAEIKGDTGPCVYPGLHLYIYSILYQITNQGKNILRAQWIFMWFYWER